MEFKVIRSFYSEAQANLYLIQLQKEGIQCFLSNENISTILPLSDSRLALNVSEEQMESAFEIMIRIDSEQDEFKKREDFREATEEDILYEKEVFEREKWLDSGKVSGKTLNYIFLGLFLIVITIIVINYFFPFLP